MFSPKICFHISIIVIIQMQNQNLFSKVMVIYIRDSVLLVNGKLMLLVGFSLRTLCETLL